MALVLGANPAAAEDPGTQKEALSTIREFCSFPAIAPDGTVYVCSKDMKLYAVFSDSPGLAKSTWPMFHQNLGHTGLGHMEGQHFSNLRYAVDGLAS
jgi:hypothetical protein